MKTNIRAAGIELTPAISTYVEKLTSGIEKHLSGEDIVVQIEVGKTSNHHKHGEIFRAEVRISGDGNDFYAASEKEDLYAAIDAVKDEIIREIKRKKNRRIFDMRRGQKIMKNVIRNLPWMPPYGKN